MHRIELVARIWGEIEHFWWVGVLGEFRANKRGGDGDNAKREKLGAQKSPIGFYNLGEPGLVRGLGSIIEAPPTVESRRI